MPGLELSVALSIRRGPKDYQKQIDLIRYRGLRSLDSQPLAPGT